MIDSVRGGRLDAAIASLRAPSAGLRVTPLGEERAVVAVPVRHRHAVGGPHRLAEIAPERVVLLPRESNRGVYDAVVSSCRTAGLAPTFLKMPDVDRDGAGRRCVRRIERDVARRIAAELHRRQEAGLSRPADGREAARGQSSAGAGWMR